MLTSEAKYVYTSDAGLVLGFHGCEESVRDAVVSGNMMLKASENRHDWLGYGFYFWQNNYERALDFATNPPGRKKIEKPAILGAVLSLGSCLDLTDKKHIRSIQSSYENLKKSAISENKNLPFNKNSKDSKDRVLRELDCSVIENLHESMRLLHRPPFDSTRGVFIEGSPIYENAGFHEKTHIQICVRNPNCIKGFFIPREEVQWPEPEKLHFLIPDNTVQETPAYYSAYLTQ
ncbi:hypothetical protein [Chitinophaga niabensis]|uniref:Uncharacterized protein n=1 Tax=Chitinophaga niabensis TaxID=536979 RepID=A0A1N6D8Y7_9BACT|nr:hypothetical protein [Chitinophaga niabensis]SIN67153.1 hypothetical protein SAMN04488055_0463 [Chitinophaga niabensis]